jgi:DnaK suppressor protein
MNRNEFVKHTQKLLVARRDALRRTLAGDIGMLRSQHEETVGDEIDAALATEQSELRSQMASFESRELKQIENALDKIRHGQYGRCETCERPIGPPRLKACRMRPSASAAPGAKSGKPLPVLGTRP